MRDAPRGRRHVYYMIDPAGLQKSCSSFAQAHRAEQAV